AAEPLLNFLKGQCDDRRLRLFGAACCRRLWDFLPEGFRAAVVAGVRFADGEIDRKELSAVAERGLNFPGRLPVAVGSVGWEEAGEAVQQVPRPPSAAGTWGRIRHAARAAVEAVAHGPRWAAAPIGERLDTCDRLRVAEKAAQAGLLRDVFGN